MSGAVDPIRIVLVEDSPSDVHLLGISLDQVGLPYELTLFSDGAEAIAYFESETTQIPDVAVLDLNVPKAEGTDILDTIRRSPRFGSVPVVVLSSSEAPQDIERVKELGADCRLLKPLDLDEFMKLGKTIVECIELKRSANSA